MSEDLTKKQQQALAKVRARLRVLENKEPETRPVGPAAAARGRLAPIETGLSLLSGAGLSTLGGVLAAPVAPFEPDSAQSILERIQSFSYEPRTDAGKRMLGSVGKGLEKVDLFATDAPEKVGITNPGFQTAAKTGLLGLPALFGPKLLRKSPLTTRQVAAQRGQQLGYVVDPADPATVAGAGTLTGFGGKIKTRQLARQRNQPITNDLVRQELGIQQGVDITPDVLAAIRSKAGQAYEAVRGAGNIAADTVYRRDLSRAVSTFKSAAKDFQGIAAKRAKKLINESDLMRRDSFDSGSAIDQIRVLRNEADVAFRAGRSAEGQAWRNLSDALEGAVERDLSRQLGPNNQLVSNYRDARQTIAKTYSVEDALAGTSVSAPKLAAQLNKGKPLSGNLRQIAEFAAEFPEVVKVPTTSVPNFSPLDLVTMGASLAASLPTTAAVGPAGLGTLLPLIAAGTRPVLRNLALGPLGQKLATQSNINAAPAMPGILGSAVLANDLPKDQ